MELSDLEKVLGIENGQIHNGPVRISAQSLTANIDELLEYCYDNQPIVINNAQVSPEAPQPNVIVLTGTSDFLGVPNLPVEAHFSIDKDARVQVFLKYALLDDNPEANKCTFWQSFPNLPQVADNSQPLEFNRLTGQIINQPTVAPINELLLSHTYYVVVSTPQQEPEFGVEMRWGINVVGHVHPEGFLGIIESLFHSTNQLTIYGTIRKPLPTETPQQLADLYPPSPEQFQFPWDIADDTNQLPKGLPGIVLQVNLNLAYHITDAITFTAEKLYLYTPLNEEWINHNTNPGFFPMQAYTGSMEIGKDIKVEVVVPIEFGIDELNVIGFFKGVSLGNLSHVAGLTGSSESPLEHLPDEIKKVGNALGKLELMSASVAVDYSILTDITVSRASFTVGMPELKWKIWDTKDGGSHFEIESIACTFDIDYPFSGRAEEDSEQERDLSVTVYGTLKIENVPFSVSASNKDGFAAFAEMTEKAEIKLNKILEKFAPGLDTSGELPGNLTINTFRVSVAPGQYYAMALLMANEPNPWKIPLGSKELFIEDVALGFTYQQEDGTISGSVSGTLKLTLDDMDQLDILVSAGHPGADSGWAFKGATGPGQEIPIGKLITALGNGITLPRSLEGLIIENLGIAFNTGNKNFTFTCESKFPVSGTAVDIVVAIDLTHKDGAYQHKFGGMITFGSTEFTLDFASSEKEKVLKATWTKTNNKPDLDLKILSDHGVAGLEDFTTLLRPKKATLKLNLEKNAKSLNLSCTLEKGGAEVLIAKHGDEWIAAIRFEAPPISTKDLGPFGSALQPHNIALDELVIVAANADAPKAPPSLKLQDQGFSKGILLQGALEFEQTSFSYPFECQLGGEKPEEKLKALMAGGAGQTTPTAPALSVASAGESLAPVEGKNNVPVGRTIGPVTFRKARLESRDKRVYVLLDASLESGGFALDLTGFNLSFPLTLLQDPVEHAKEIAVGLDGLSIAYAKPPLTISGGFARTEVVSPYVDDLYQGHLLIKAEAFQITVLGSYGNIKINGEKKPALFLFGTYAGMVGGPPAFFVTGLALGGGYNTRLVLPPVEKVAEFPLVQAVTAPDKFTQGELMKAVQPSYGDYWLAVGVKFTSFKMADSFALFSVAFGNRLQFALLGLTKLTVPAEAKKDTCAVYAELAIRAVLDPEAGVLSIEGQLTQNSYVFSKEIRLTGGFAFFVWFGNATEAGDFVISLGGYHPAFLPPPHYPVVPRVGIHGQIGALTITGEAYFALTPSCLMAGQKLEAVFKSGKITAAFVAFADFVVAWAPFHYDARIGIGIAVAYQSFRTFKLEVSASLHIWGPPFAGTARVSLRIVSFTVEFGDTRGAQPAPLTWDEFQRAFLPSSDSNSGGLSTIRITEGLVREVKRGEGENEVTYRIVNPHELMIETDSVVPCSEVCVGKAQKTGTAHIGIRPMHKTTLESRHIVSINAAGGSVEDKFKPVQWSQKNYPEALWSASAATGKPEAGMVKDVLSGVVLRVEPKTPEHQLGPFLIEKFAYEPIPKNIRWSSTPSVPTAIPEQFSKVEEVNQLRSDIRACLVKHVTEPGKSPWNEIALKNTSANPSERFQAVPSRAALGQSLGGS